MKSLLIAALFALQGCYIYAEEDVYENPVPPADVTCQTSTDCPSDSFCETDIGQCVVADTCQESLDCEEGFACNEANACVPESDLPPVACADIEEEQACIAQQSCVPTYYGVYCEDPDGLPCSAEDANCACAEFRYGSCVDDQ